MKLPDISQIRGMGEPLFFSFNVDKRHRVLCHAVVFTSFEVDEAATIKLCEPRDDPRMEHFMQFCIQNYGKEIKDELRKEIEIMDKEITELQTKINQLNKEIKSA